MGVFAVTRIKGNDSILLGKYGDLQEAKTAGANIYESSDERMIISVIEANFDENDIIIGPYKLYHVWGCY